MSENLHPAVRLGKTGGENSMIPNRESQQRRRMGARGKGKRISSGSR